MRGDVRSGGWVLQTMLALASTVSGLCLGCGGEKRVLFPKLEVKS